MEILLAACLLAWAAGAQSEQAKLGISPAQRALIREQVRHDKTVRRIAEKHGTTPAEPDGEPPLTVPEAFRSGYRGHTPLSRVATPAGRHVGDWAARGVYWTKDTGTSALREYRKRRKTAGEADPAPVLTPPAVVPPMPTVPPTVGLPAGVTLTKPTPASGSPAAPSVAAVPIPRDPDSGPTTPVATPEPHVTLPAQNGAGRMAAEVSYESVMDESDELSLMCDDDLTVYERIRERCEREIGRADTLTAQLKSPGIQAWVTRCADQYRVILAQLEELKSNTTAQGEGVVKAKDLLLAGQGLYADIAAGMETVEEREFYTSDAIDGEDANASAETYETQGVPA